MEKYQRSRTVATASYAAGITRSLSRALRSGKHRSLYEIGDTDVITNRFPDGEVFVTIDIGDKAEPPDVWHLYHRFPIEPDQSVDSGLQELLIAAHTLASIGGEIVLHCPFLPYTRSDKPDKLNNRPAISPIVARQMRFAGISRIVTLPAGNLSHIPDCYSPIDLNFEPVIEAIVGSLTTKPELIISPDKGAQWIAKEVGEKTDTPWTCADKTRYSPHSVAVSLDTFSSVNTVVIVDDLVSSGNTVRAVVDQLQTPGSSIEYIGFRGIHYRPLQNHSLDDMGCDDIKFLTVPIHIAREHLIGEEIKS